jgi:hypothetical protein
MSDKLDREMDFNFFSFEFKEKIFVVNIFFHCPRRRIVDNFIMFVDLVRDCF